MIYAFLTYLAFLAVYDHWATDAVNWQIAYFTAQYAFFATVAILEICRGKYVVMYMFIAILFITLIIFELLCVNSSLERYEAMRSGPPAYTLTALMILFFYLTIRKQKKWIGLRQILRRRYS